MWKINRRTRIHSEFSNPRRIEKVIQAYSFENYKIDIKLYRNYTPASHTKLIDSKISLLPTFSEKFMPIATLFSKIFHKICSHRVSIGNAPLRKVHLDIVILTEVARI